MGAPRPRLAVIAAMRQELRPFARALRLTRAPGAGPPYWQGSIGRVDVVAGITAIGTAPADTFTEAVLTCFRVDHVIGIGIAGAVGDTLTVGDLLVPAQVVDDRTGVPLRPVAIDGREPAGTLLTSDALVSDKATIPDLIAQGVVAVDMETYAIGVACERHGVPWSVLRAISDRAADDVIDEEVLGMANPDGSANLPAVLRFVLTHPTRVPHLATLARGMQAAYRASASAAVRACSNY